MGFGDTTDDAEADAGTWLLGLHGRFGSIEGFEDTFEIALFDPGSAVGDGDDNRAGGIGSGNAEPLAGGTVLTGVADEISQGLFEPCGITGDLREAGGDLEFDCTGCLVDFEATGGDGMVDEVGDSEKLGIGWFGAMFEARPGEDIIHHTAEATGFFADHSAVFGNGIGGDNALGQVVGCRGDNGDGRPQFVGDAGDEFHAEPGEFFAATGREDEEGAAEGEQAEAGKTNQHVAALGLGHNLIEGGSLATDLEYGDTPVRASQGTSSGGFREQCDFDVWLGERSVGRLKVDLACPQDANGPDRTIAKVTLCELREKALADGIEVKNGNAIAGGRAEHTATGRRATG